VIFTPVEAPEHSLPFDNGGTTEWLQDPPWVEIPLDWHIDWRVRVSPWRAGWVLQWLWYANDRSWKNQHIYPVRKTRRGGRQAPVVVHRLHVELMKQIKRRPSKNHTMVDHIDGDTLNCQDHNLRWATPSTNRKNTSKARGDQDEMDRRHSHLHRGHLPAN
jgi:hypothetical protein